MNAMMRVAAVLAALALGACATTRPVQPPAAERAQLLAAATASAQQCLARFPDSGACQYAQAQVQGLTARARPLEAPALLKGMLASLTKAEARDPALDHAGPARLAAIVLLRAPPWPLGPGDVDAALTAAQRAVQRDPAYPPNLITLGQAQARSVGAPPARATFVKAQQAAQVWAVAADRSKWQQDIEQALHDLQ
jgi:hypothetical protein